MNRLRWTAALLAVASITATAACSDEDPSQQSIRPRPAAASGHPVRGLKHPAPGSTRATAAFEHAVETLATTRALTATARIGRSRLILRATSPTRHTLRSTNMAALANLDLAVEHNGRTLLNLRRVDDPENGYAATEFGVRFSSGTDRDGEWLDTATGPGHLLGRLFGYDKATGRLYVHRLFVRLLGFLSSPRVSVHRAGRSSMGHVFEIRANTQVLTRVAAIGMAAGMGMGRKVFRQSIAQYVSNDSVSLYAWVRRGRLSRLSIGDVTVGFRQSANRIARPSEYVETDDNWLVMRIRDVFASAF